MSILCLLIGIQFSPASTGKQGVCTKARHIDGKDTIYIEPGPDGNCQYCVQPTSWYKSLNDGLALHVCEDQVDACSSSREQCDSLRKESDKQVSDMARRIVLLDSTYQGHELELKLCKGQKDLKDSIASSYSRQLEDERKLVSTWRFTALGLLIAAVAEGFIIYWTNK